ncbi:MAG: type II secretion system F family protein [Anaerovorax sp.]
MSLYKCSYIDTVKHKPKKLMVSAKTKKDCITVLAYRGIQDAKIKEGADLHGLEYLLYPDHRKPKTGLKVMADFFDQLSFLLKAGMQLYQSLDSMSRSGEPNLQGICLTLMPFVEEGLPLDEAMLRTKLFHQDLIYQVKSGVESGDMVTTMKNISISLIKKKSNRSKISGMMVYPAFMFFMMVGVMTLMLGFIVPTISKTFADLGGTLPSLTLAVMAVSDFMIANFPFIGIGIGVFIFLIITLRNRSKKFKSLTDHLILKIPVFGQLQLKSILCDFCTTMSTMMDCGISLVPSVEICSNTIKNEYLRAIFAKSKHLMEVNGIDLYESLKNNLIIPPIFLQLISVGVQSGNIVDVMKNIATRYDDETSALAKKLASLLEPSMILLMVLIGGVCVIAMMMPIFSISDFM